jgi:hypothetical protein
LEQKGPYAQQTSLFDWERPDERPRTQGTGEWLPEKVAELKREGRLNEELQAAAVMAQEEIESLMKNSHYSVHESGEVALPQFILLPPEGPQAHRREPPRFYVTGIRMIGMRIKHRAFAAVLIIFGAMTSTIRADEQWGLRPGVCYRSGLASTACVPDVPRYFNRVEPNQRKRVRSR